MVPHASLFLFEGKISPTGGDFCLVRVVLPPVPCFLSPPFGGDCPRCRVPTRARPRASAPAQNCSRTSPALFAGRCPTTCRSSGPQGSQGGQERLRQVGRGLRAQAPAVRPQVSGKEVDLAKAIKEAAKLIGKAKLPLYGGLATDVEGMRAVMALAERSRRHRRSCLERGAIPQLQDPADRRAGSPRR